jgi:hypothetical protein
MPLTGFEPDIQASERPQIHALDGAAPGIDPKHLHSHCIIKFQSTGDNVFAYNYVLITPSVVVIFIIVFVNNLILKYKFCLRYIQWT